MSSQLGSFDMAGRLARHDFRSPVRILFALVLLPAAFAPGMVRGQAAEAAPDDPFGLVVPEETVRDSAVQEESPPGEAAPNEPPLDYPALVDRYLQGEHELEGKLREQRAAIPAVEDYLLTDATSGVELEPWLAQLGDDDFMVREQASNQLRKVLRQAKPQLEAALGAAEELEVRWRLRRLLEQAKSGRDAAVLLPQLLKNMYNRHRSAITPEYLALLEKDALNPRVMLFVRHVDPDSILKGNSDLLSPELRLRYLLALKYATGESDFTTKLLQGYTGAAILKEAAATYWPVELQPLLKDGAYHWTVRCARLADRQATDVLMMSIDQTANQGAPFGVEAQQSVDEIKAAIGKTRPPGNMVHLDTWSRWDYLFRYETPYLGTYQGVALMLQHSDYFRPKNVQVIPRGMKVVTARVPHPNQQLWTVGQHLEWAKELYPADVVGKIQFSKEPTEARSQILPAGEKSETMSMPEE